MLIEGMILKFRKNVRFFCRAFVYCAYLSSATFLCLEIVFRSLPTAELFEREEVNEHYPILKYKPHQQITYSLGTSFYAVINKSTNDLGFVADYDYLDNKGTEIVLIGDLS